MGPPLRGGAGGEVLSGPLPIGPEWRELFATFEHTAYRLELRDRYSSSNNQQPVRDYNAGRDVDLSWLDPWLGKVGAAKAEGRTYQRVRVVSVPLTDYAKYALWVARLNVEAGENIRYLDRASTPEGLVDFDYWLFDSRTAARMHFDEDDILLGYDLITDPETLVELNYWRDAAVHASTSRDEFAAKHLDQR